MHDADGKPITYKEYYLPKDPGDPTTQRSNRIVIGSDGNAYVSTTHYGDNGSTPFVHIQHDPALAAVAFP